MRSRAVELWRKACTDIEPNFDFNRAPRDLHNTLLAWTWRYDPWNVLQFDYDRGILLLGDIGRGKSATLLILRRYHALLYNEDYTLHQRDHRLGIRYAPASLIVGAYGDGGMEGIAQYTDKDSNLIIDELGREPAEANNFGTKLDVLQYVLQTRYDNRHTGVTHATTNMDVDEIIHRYGAHIADRFSEMFNIYKFHEGESLRQ